MKKFLVLILALLLSTQCYAATGWSKTKPAGSDNPGTIDTTIGENNAAIDLMLSSYSNCKLAYDTAAQLTVTAGGVMVSNSAGTVRLMLANAAATTVTWADIDTGAEAPSTTYYVYAIASATTDTAFTVKLSTSASAPTGITYYKKLGSFYNDASSNITLISTDGFISVPTGITVTATALPSGNQGPTTTGHEYFYLTMGIDTTGAFKTISGYASVGTAIPLPSGCAQGNCNWIISPKFMALNGVAAKAFTLGIGTDRVVTMSIIGTNWVS